MTFWRFLCLSVLSLLWLVACGGTEPAEPTAPPPTAVSTDPIELPTAAPDPTDPAEPAETIPAEEEATVPSPTAVVTPTTIPTATTTPPQADIAEAEFNGVSFFYDQNIVDNVTAVSSPAFAGAYGLPPDGPTAFFYDVPDYVMFNIAVVGDPATTWPPQLAIQPYKDETGAVYTGYDAWEFERNRLAEFANNMNDPITAVGGMSNVHLQPQSFSNGSGLRYVGILPPGPGLPTVTNDELYYIYNGFTDDQRYFVYLQFPISHPDLPSLSDIDYAELDALLQAGQDPMVLFNEALNGVAQADPNSFTPTLSQLDSMMSTLFVPSDASTVSSIPSVDLGSCVPDVSFVEDVTIPDGSPIEPNTVFTKTWRIINDGTCPLTAAFAYTPANESQIRPANYNIRPPLVQPGETFDISVPLVAPPLAGYYRSEWHFVPPFNFDDPAQSEPFGPNFYTEITVNRNAAVEPPTFGRWDVISYNFGPAAAITEEEAQGYTGTAVVFGPDSISFGDETCTDVSYNGEYLTAGEYFETFYQTSTDYVYLQPEAPIAITRTTCDLPGFSEFILHDEGFPQIIINRDGVFFILYPRQ